MGKLLYLSRKIHRLLVLIISVLILIMAGTGTLLKYQSFVSNNFPSIDLGAVRYLHGNLSLFFIIVLILMAASGLILYFLPEIIKRRGKKDIDVKQ